MYMHMYILSITVSVKRTKTKTTLGSFSLRVYLEYKRKYTLMRTCTHTYFGWCLSGPQDWVDFMKYPAGPAVGERAPLWSTKRGLFCWRGSLPRQPPLPPFNLCPPLSVSLLQSLILPVMDVNKPLSLSINLCITFCVMDMTDTSNCGLMRKCVLLLF